ncbi:Uma2 family endonuclease [Roseofilum sp. BLCC_M154]|uniref:Uma2 family endonuclease n=1 Tax=Roseofilum acuticapitatum BLCC-M154 TaxID=3022444 RepID=A0ABT7AUV4_9CYAN|nr:Uma2 family endonuclease [Roseofilum acuticapitatum]MDJ1170700.1 Uma2 family endonuclease [Roseofilum acuticapitatum BLCC-M154]
MVSVHPQIEYPESDGLPLADNTLQFRYITTIQGGLDALYLDNPDVFIAGDLLWYPVEGDNETRMAPDVMVAFGRPKGDRRSYKQWEEGGIAPQVVFEIASRSNTLKELEEKKLKFYNRYGVQEYYLFDPERGTLKGWMGQQEDELLPIASMQNWVSPLLKVRFQVTEVGELELYTPSGERFATYVEAIAQLKQERERIQQLEQAQRRAIAPLAAMGLDAEAIANILSLSLETVQNYLD